MKCLHRYLVHLHTDMWSKMIPPSRGSRRRWECARRLCTIHRAASSLMTAGNHSRSRQPRDKIIKLCPTFSYFTKTTYEKYCLIIPWPSSSMLIRPPSLAIRPCVSTPKKYNNFLLCHCNIFIAQESRQRIKIKQPRGYQIEYIHGAVWVLSVVDNKKKIKNKIKHILNTGCTQTPARRISLVVLQKQTTSMLHAAAPLCWLRDPAEATACPRVTLLMVSYLGVRIKDRYLMLCEHVRHEGIVSIRYVVLWTMFFGKFKRKTQSASQNRIRKKKTPWNRNKC